MGKHRKPTRNWGPYVTAGLALEAATLLGVAYAGDGHIPGANCCPRRSSSTARSRSPETRRTTRPYRMADSLPGWVQAAGAATTYSSNYPRSLGPSPALGDPTYDVSEGLATERDRRCRQGREGEPQLPGRDDLRRRLLAGGRRRGQGDPDTRGAGPQRRRRSSCSPANPRRNDGGILPALPAGVYVPILGVTFGGRHHTRDHQGPTGHQAVRRRGRRAGVRPQRRGGPQCRVGLLLSALRLLQGHPSRARDPPTGRSSRRAPTEPSRMCWS